MFWKKKSKEPKKPKTKTITLVKYRSVFTTIDGANHIGCCYKWAHFERFDVKEDLRRDIARRSYIVDKDGIMYPLANVFSIDFELVDSKTIIDDFYHEWEWFFDNEEVEKMTEYSE